MPKNRYCVVIELKPECVEAYREIHQNPWQKMPGKCAVTRRIEMLAIRIARRLWRDTAEPL